MGKWLDQLQQVAADYAQRPGSAGGERSLAKMLLSAGAQGVADAATLPRDVYEGRVDPRSDEGIDRAFNMAGTIGLGARTAVTAAPRLAPEAGSLGMFIGPKAVGADLAGLSKAQQLEAAGVHRDQIWKDTLWGREAGGKWHSEIDDSTSQIGRAAAEGFLEGEPMTGRLAANLWHKPAYEAYPELRSMPVNVTREGDYRLPFAGAYNPATSEITGQAAHTGAAREMLLHEVQHPIQDIEGFAAGGSPEGMVGMANELADPIAREAGRRIQAGQMTEDQALDWMMEQNEGNYAGQLYRRLAGEAQARNVQTRRDWDMAKRREIPPWASEDVPRERQIVRY